MSERRKTTYIGKEDIQAAFVLKGLLANPRYSILVGRVCLLGRDLGERYWEPRV